MGRDKTFEAEVLGVPPMKNMVRINIVGMGGQTILKADCDTIQTAIEKVRHLFSDEFEYDLPAVSRIEIWMVEHSTMAIKEGG